MRRKIIAGNWKMNNDFSAAQSLITKINSGLSGKKLNAEVIICPPFTSLSEANSLIKNTSVKLGAQNMYYENEGAYTGEISANMLKSVGCEFVILGHSERRTIFYETDGLINKKIKMAIQSGLKPIFCIGETLEQRENKITNDVLKTQITIGLNGLIAEDLKNIIVAYEPVWAIGTGKNATPNQAEEAHQFIRNLIKDNFSQEIADNLIIQYGGSVKPENAKELLSQKNIDGALVGGASLKAESFIGIIEAV